MLLIDAANVIGSRPNGWWRNRAKAAADLVDEVRGAIAAGHLSEPVTIVLEGEGRHGELPGRSGGVEVVHAAGSGDDEVAARAAQGHEPVVVVTADRELSARVRSVGADVVGPRWLLDRL